MRILKNFALIVRKHEIKYKMSEELLNSLNLATAIENATTATFGLHKKAEEAKNAKFKIRKYVMKPKKRAQLRFEHGVTIF